MFYKKRISQGAKMTKNKIRADFLCDQNDQTASMPVVHQTEPFEKKALPFASFFLSFWKVLSADVTPTTLQYIQTF